MLLIDITLIRHDATLLRSFIAAAYADATAAAVIFQLEMPR